MSVTGGILGWAFSWLAVSWQRAPPGRVRAVGVPHGCHPAGPGFPAAGGCTVEKKICHWKSDLKQTSP